MLAAVRVGNWCLAPAEGLWNMHSNMGAGDATEEARLELGARPAGDEIANDGGDTSGCEVRPKFAERLGTVLPSGKYKCRPTSGIVMTSSRQGPSND